MNAREERGLVIAALCKLKRNPDGWLVPSQTAATVAYTVDVEKQSCTCPDHQEGGHKCKHLFAVEITIKREFHDDGTVTDTESVTFTQKKTYRQDWPKYNLAQATEKRRFQVLLRDLCRTLPEPKRAPNRRGPKPHRLCDIIFSMVFKVYAGLSSRRFTCDLQEAHEKGYTTRMVPGSNVWGFMDDERCEPILKSLIAYSARPLRSVDVICDRQHRVRIGETRIPHGERQRNPQAQQPDRDAAAFGRERIGGRHVQSLPLAGGGMNAKHTITCVDQNRAARLDSGRQV